MNLQTVMNMLMKYSSRIHIIMTSIMHIMYIHQETESSGMLSSRGFLETGFLSSTVPACWLWQQPLLSCRAPCATGVRHTAADPTSSTSCLRCVGTGWWEGVCSATLQIQGSAARWHEESSHALSERHDRAKFTHVQEKHLDWFSVT